jgi:pimeloyl-ACP methyl ester carboxylesterase
MATMRVSSTDGVRVAVHDLGGHGRPFLVCHATGFCGRAYEPLAAELVETRHVYALDYRGHGDTAPPANGRFDWEGLADDLDAVVTAIADGPLDVFGHSMGGATAMMVELRRPGVIRSAYLYEPIVMPAATELAALRDTMGDAARRRKPSFPTKADALVRYASRPPLSDLRASALAAYVEHGFEERDGAAWLKCTPEQEAATFEASGKPLASSMAAVETVVTVAVGAPAAEFSPAALAPSLVDVLPHARLETFPTLGHFGPLQDPIAVARGILALVAG